MTRARVLSVITGLATLAFSPLAMAQDDPNVSGGDRYGGAQPTEDMDTTQQEELKAAEPEEAEPSATGGAAYGMGATGGDTYGVVQEEPIEPEPMIVEEPAEEVEVGPYTGFGMAITVGGGVTDFVDSDVTDVTDTGGAWDARLAIGTRSILGLEAAYVGSAQDMDALGLDDDAVLVGNGLEGLARLNLGTYALQPYVLGGLGWTRYDIANEDFNTSSIEDQDDVMTVPVGAGFNARLGGGFILDGRFTYRFTFDDNMFDQATFDIDEEGGADLDNWAATARLGYEF